MNKPPHPGEVLSKKYLHPMELTITRASEAMGIARKNLSGIINGHAGVSPLMAIRLSKAFGTTPEFWLELQNKYDLWNVYKNNKDIQVEKLV